MGKTRKSADPVESVLRDAKEVTALEQYKHLADRPKPRKPPKNYKYLDELAHLQFELIKLQESVRLQGLRVVIIFEGRDAAGKGGVIKRITQSLNPRICRVVALGTPTERERGHVRAAYARVDCLLERAAMMQAWADFIEGAPFERRVSDAGKLAKAMQEANRLKKAEVFRRTSP